MIHFCHSSVRSWDDYLTATADRINLRMDWLNIRVYDMSMMPNELEVQTLLEVNTIKMSVFLPGEIPLRALTGMIANNEVPS